MPCCWVSILQHFTPNSFTCRVWLFKKKTDTQGKDVLHKWVTKGQAIFFDSYTLWRPPTLCEMYSIFTSYVHEFDEF
jgi:hypothetical protein